MHSHGWIGTLRNFRLFFCDVLTISTPNVKSLIYFHFPPEFNTANFLFFNGNLESCSILIVPITMAMQIYLRDTRIMG